jgi:hypothetical protein
MTPNPTAMAKLIQQLDWRFGGLTRQDEMPEQTVPPPDRGTVVMLFCVNANDVVVVDDAIVDAIVDAVVDAVVVRGRMTCNHRQLLANEPREEGFGSGLVRHD